MAELGEMSRAKRGADWIGSELRGNCGAQDGGGDVDLLGTAPRSIRVFFTLWVVDFIPEQKNGIPSPKGCQKPKSSGSVVYDLQLPEYTQGIERQRRNHGLAAEASLEVLQRRLI